LHKSTQDFLLLSNHYDLQCIVDYAYPNLEDKFASIECFMERTIFSPTNQNVDFKINCYIVHTISGERKEYLSINGLLKDQIVMTLYDLLCTNLILSLHLH
jgi:hypothetical protein